MRARSTARAAPMSALAARRLYSADKHVRPAEEDLRYCVAVGGSPIVAPACSMLGQILRIDGRADQQGVSRFRCPCATRRLLAGEVDLGIGEDGQCLRQSPRRSRCRPSVARRPGLGLARAVWQPTARG